MREQAKRYWLKEDIIGGKGAVYGKKKDVVTEVAVRGEVIIVADKKGERFPVHIDKLNAM